MPGKFNFGLGPAALAGPGAPRGNLFGEAALPMWSEEGGAAAGSAGGGGGKGKNGDKEICELCGGSFSHPVTYHMRHAHPGKKPVSLKVSSSMFRPSSEHC